MSPTPDSAHRPAAPPPDLLPLTAVRAAFAAAALDLPPGPPVDPHVGPVTLRPHQQFAVARLRRLLDTHHGALLADAVGLGKTWVALALLRPAHTPLVVAPAALRRMWRDAASAAHLPLAFCSTESLSAPTPPSLPATPDLVVVDEAHHFRTPTTRRRARLTAVCTHARTLLLSATPVHNTPHDLAALLALFLGARAYTLDAATLAHLVVRRRHVDLRSTRHPHPATPDTLLPHVARTRWHQLTSAPAVRHALFTLPPPVPPADGTPTPALATLTLVRLWTSSDAALRAALRRRLTRAAALAHALTAGHHPDRRTLAHWATHADALQLPLFLDGTTPSDATALAAHVDAHAAALRRTLATLDTAPPADPARLAWLRAVRDRHPGARVVAFTQFTDTARAFFRALAPDGHVGLLTAAGGRIASGPLARDALLARFAPLAPHAPAPPLIERVDLLVASDCVSEGLDLRGASVVVHLDLPWTPARLAQRVGRAARLGAPHATIHVYGLRPDPTTARWLRLARRLQAKARAARRALGTRPTRADATRAQRTPLAHHAAAHRLYERWLTTVPAHSPPLGLRDATPPFVAAVRCGRAGFIAVYAPAPPTRLGTPRDTMSGAPLDTPDPSFGTPPPTVLTALDGRPPTAAPHAVARALRRLAHPDARTTPAPAALVNAARGAVHAWARRRAAADAVGYTAPAALHAPDGAAPGRPPHGPTVPGPTRTVRAALAHADAALHAAPPHVRATRATAVAGLRQALERPLNAGIEHALLALATPPHDHDAWLSGAHQLLVATAPRADAGAPAAPPLDTSLTTPHIAALVLLLP